MENLELLTSTENKITKRERKLIETIINGSEKIEFADFDSFELERLRLALSDLEDIPYIIKAINFVIHKKIPALFTHHMRTGFLGERVANNMGLNQENSSKVRNGLMIHDVGKWDWPKKLHDSNFPASIDQFASHPLVGEKMLDENTDLLDDIYLRQIVRNHHSKLDGSGYPEDIVGIRLFITTQIATVIDMYDAMTNRSFNQNRTYFGKLSPNSALEILYTEAKNGKINPDVVEALNETIQL